MIFPRFFGQIMNTQTSVELVTGQTIELPEDFTPGEVRAAKKWADSFARGVAEFIGVPVERVRVPPATPEEFIRGYREAFLVPRSPTPTQAERFASSHAKHFASTVKNSGGVE